MNRSILQRWKRTMHVPLRLDVYYQHPQVEGSEKAGERELLERWCLEYAPTGTGNDGVDHLLHNNVTQSTRLMCLCLMVLHTEFFSQEDHLHLVLFQSSQLILYSNYSCYSDIMRTKEFPSVIIIYCLC